jgi:hypothetical protein
MIVRPGMRTEDKTARTGPPQLGHDMGWDNCGWIVAKGTGSPGQDSQVRSVWTGQPSRPAWMDEPGQDSCERTARTRQLGTGKQGQENQERRAGTGKPEKADRILQPGEETEAERPEHDS